MAIFFLLYQFIFTYMIHMEWRLINLTSNIMLCLEGSPFFVYYVHLARFLRCFGGGRRSERCPRVYDVLFVKGQSNLYQQDHLMYAVSDVNGTKTMYFAVWSHLPVYSV